MQYPTRSPASAWDLLSVRVTIRLGYSITHAAQLDPEKAA